jgi:hypothetical protein
MDVRWENPENGSVAVRANPILLMIIRPDGMKGEVHISAMYFQHDAKYSVARGVPYRILENVKFCRN